MACCFFDQNHKRKCSAVNDARQCILAAVGHQFCHLLRWWKYIYLWTYQTFHPTSVHVQFMSGLLLTWLGQIDQNSLQICQDIYLIYIYFFSFQALVFIYFVCSLDYIMCMFFFTDMSNKWSFCKWLTSTYNL